MLQVINFILTQLLPTLIIMALFAGSFWAGKEVGKMQEATKQLSANLKKLEQKLEAK